MLGQVWLHCNKKIWLYEMSDMQESLQKMKHGLKSRIRQIRSDEQTAMNSSQQAMQAWAQALSNLRIDQKTPRAKEDFLHNRRNEFRAPLNDIIGLSYLCLKEEMSPSLRNALTCINKAGSLLLDMFNRMLDFASSEEGQLRMERTLFSPVRLASLIEQSLAARVNEAGIELLVKLDSSIPSRIYGDERHLEEILRKLLGLAIQRTAAGIVHLEIAVTENLAANKIKIRFAVTDCAKEEIHSEASSYFLDRAVTPEDISKININRQSLSLASLLVRLMGGELSVTYSPGKGSTLDFELEFDLPTPAESVGDIPEDLPGSENTTNKTDSVVTGQTSNQHPSGKKSVVLVVEDNEINRMIAYELLEQNGLEVLEAGDGREAVNMVKNHDVDLILMDVQMPVMDGMEATAKIREFGKDRDKLPIIAMTGQTDQESRENGERVGMNDYLTKPIDPDALVEALEKWLPGGLPKKSEEDYEEVHSKPEEKSGIDKDSLLSIADSHVINVTAGLATVGGNEKLYAELLVRFLNHHGDGYEQMQLLLEKKDYKGASRLAHTIKGVAANLGLEKVTKLSKQMESSLPEKRPDDQLLHDFEQAMKEALHNVQQMNTQNCHSARNGNKKLAEDSRYKLLALLAELPTRVETDWGGVEYELEDMLYTVNDTPYANDIIGLLSAVNDFNLADMIDRADKLRQILEPNYLESNKKPD